MLEINIDNSEQSEELFLTIMDNSTIIMLDHSSKSAYFASRELSNYVSLVRVQCSK